MKNALKTELYKIFSIRSTYIVIVFAVVASLALSFIGEGLKYAGSPFDASKLMRVALQSTQLSSLLVTVVAILHITNEYRHNTISYTLTAISSRTKVFLAKIISITIFSVLLSLVILLVVVAGAYIGLLVANAPALPAQHFPISVVARIVFYNLGLSLLAMIVSVLLRNIAGALVMMLIGFNIIEGLLSIVIKANADYLPMSSARLVIGDVMSAVPPGFTPLKAALVFSCWLLGGFLISWYTFLRRDAN